jgi:hypothetical protein
MRHKRASVQAKSSNGLDTVQTNVTLTDRVVRSWKRCSDVITDVLHMHETRAGIAFSRVLSGLGGQMRADRWQLGEVRG